MIQAKKLSTTILERKRASDMGCDGRSDQRSKGATLRPDPHFGDHATPISEIRPPNRGGLSVRFRVPRALLIEDENITAAESRPIYTGAG